MSFCLLLGGTVSSKTLKRNTTSMDAVLCPLKIQRVTREISRLMHGFFYFVAFSTRHKRSPECAGLRLLGWMATQNIFAKVEVIALPAVSSVGTVYTAVLAMLL